MQLNLVPLSDSPIAEVTYDTADGDQCEGHAAFDSNQNTLTLSVDDGASACLSMNATYAVTVTESSLTLASGPTLLSFVN